MLTLGGKDPDAVASARPLAEEANVPYELARGLLSRLADAGLLESHRGRTGGFHLARPASEITMGEILSVAGEDLALNICSADRESCTNSDTCPMHPVWLEASDMLRTYLGEKTLAEVLESNLVGAGTGTC
jgi:Rrf2 family protein